MANNKSPYSFPARSRKAMIEEIVDNTNSHISGPYARDGRYPVVFNVKVYTSDFRFVKLFQPTVPGQPAYDYALELATEELKRQYADFAERQYGELDLANLFNWSLEDTQRSVTEDDGFRMVWDEDGPVAELTFCGRSSGYIAIESFDGLQVSGLNEDELRDALQEVDFTFLRRFYKYVRQCMVDFTQDKAVQEVEYQAAFNFVCNILGPAWDDYLKEQEAIATAQDEAQRKQTTDQAVIDALKALYKLVEGTSGEIYESMNPYARPQMRQAGKALNDALGLKQTHDADGFERHLYEGGEWYEHPGSQG